MNTTISVCVFQGFGHLLPSSEDRGLLGVVYDSVAFPQHNRPYGQTTRLTVHTSRKVSRTGMSLPFVIRTLRKWVAGKKHISPILVCIVLVYIYTLRWSTLKLQLKAWAFICFNHSPRLYLGQASVKLLVVLYFKERQKKSVCAVTDAWSLTVVHVPWTVGMWLGNFGHMVTVTIYVHYVHPHLWPKVMTLSCRWWWVGPGSTKYMGPQKQ